MREKCYCENMLQEKKHRGKKHLGKNVFGKILSPLGPQICFSFMFFPVAIFHRSIFPQILQCGTSKITRWKLFFYLSSVLQPLHQSSTQHVSKVHRQDPYHLQSDPIVLALRNHWDVKALLYPHSTVHASYWQECATGVMIEILPVAPMLWDNALFKSY